MTKPYLTVHAGTFKTGTTAIQKVLARNRQFLERDQKLLYPETAEIEAGGHHNLVYQLTGSWKFRPELGGFEQLKSEYRSSRAASILISAENLSSYALANHEIAPTFARLAGELGCELRTIFYVRPQWEYIDSYYSQGVKTGYTTCSFKDFARSALSESIYDYEKVVKPWEDVAGEVIVRPYAGKETLADFLEHVGIHLEDQDSVRSANEVNVRFGAKRLEFMRRMGAAFERVKMPVKQRIPLARKLREIVERIEIEDVPFSGVDAELANVIRENFEQSNYRLSRRYCMGLDWLEPPASQHLNPSTFDFRSLDEDERQAFDDAVAQLLKLTDR